MTESDVQAKFRANARHALDDGRIEQVIGMVSSLESNGNIRALMDICR